MTLCKTRAPSWNEALLAGAQNIAAQTSDDARALLMACLDEALPRFESPESVRGAMESLLGDLFALRRALPPESWESACQAARSHPLLEICREDPFTRRAHAKPRGYPGDAELIDFLYGVPSGAARENTTLRGAAIRDFLVASSSGVSVRWRRELLAQRIDETASRAAGASVLSVAGGHFREGLRSAAVGRSLGRMVVIDQDPDCLELIHLEQPWVQALPVRIQSLLRGRSSLGTFDLIYSAGLYDYLADGVANLLTRRLAAMLAPGGRLLIANFTSDAIESGYMDCVMDWRLIYRSPSELEELGAATGLSFRCFLDPTLGAAYLEVTNAA